MMIELSASTLLGLILLFILILAIASYASYALGQNIDRIEEKDAYEAAHELELNELLELQEIELSLEYRSKIEELERLIVDARHFTKDIALKWVDESLQKVNARLTGQAKGPD